MKVTAFKGDILRAHGKKLPKKLKYNTTYEKLENYSEVVAAGEIPSEKDIVKFVNRDRKAAARTAIITATLAANGIVKPTLESDEQFRLETVTAAFMADGKTSRAEAKVKASEALGIAWADADDDDDDADDDE